MSVEALTLSGGWRAGETLPSGNAGAGPGSHGDNIDTYYEYFTIYVITEVNKLRVWVRGGQLRRKVLPRT